jgi:hypothetical protein
MLGVVLGLATLIGGFAAVIAFVPRPSVSVGDPVDPKNAFSSAFTVSNNNLPLEHVAVGVIPRQVDMSTHNRVSADVDAVLTVPSWQAHNLGIDEKLTFSLTELFGREEGGIKFPEGAQLETAEIIVTVDYDPWFIPWSRRKKFRFRTHRQSNNQLYWYSVPLQ